MLFRLPEVFAEAPLVLALHPYQTYGTLTKKYTPLAGDFDAGAVKEEVFYNFEPRGLKTVAFTPMLSEHLFVARSNLDPDVIRALREALYSLRDSERGRAVMQGIKKATTGMVPAQDSDYDNLRAILKALDERPIP